MITELHQKIAFMMLPAFLNEKLQSLKYYYKYKLGLNHLNIDIVKMYYNEFNLINDFFVYY